MNKTLPQSSQNNTQSKDTCNEGYQQYKDENNKLQRRNYIFLSGFTEKDIIQDHQQFQLQMNNMCEEEENSVIKKQFKVQYTQQTTQQSSNQKQTRDPSAQTTDKNSDSDLNKSQHFLSQDKSSQSFSNAFTKKDDRHPKTQKQLYRLILRTFALRFYRSSMKSYFINCPRILKPLEQLKFKDYILKNLLQQSELFK
ncbi:hypothetical protein PPERSA_04191 [Pseudocohnilembus persalinus]|uniref:Uncharacterized protein n=1 Tax=Pseudocohnilembus persalinus TaxID=266149 RepID=A0A0V0QN98_PSEPJ|nr:hypothetical protein PPERSA_04191 [Pseudocohnilembus persalinus]|eukprot:KRX03639.1 hypothetical protein PPERSA_04191 [Pseudocohnilembus persalinus]